MKSIKDLREQYDLITEKEEHDMNKLSQLVRAGLFDAKKLSALKRAMEKPADRMTAQEKRMMISLLDALMSEVLTDKQVYRKVKQDVMKEAKDWTTKDYLSKNDPRFGRGYPDNSKVPAVLLLKRKSMRVFPDGQKVALYYAQAIDKYVSIPFSEAGVSGLNEGLGGKLLSIGSFVADVLSSNNSSSSTDDGRKYSTPKEAGKAQLNVGGPAKDDNRADAIRSRTDRLNRLANQAMAKGVRENFQSKLEVLREDDIDSWENRVFGTLDHSFTPYGGGGFGGGGRVKSLGSTSGNLAVKPKPSAPPKYVPKRRNPPETPDRRRTNTPSSPRGPGRYNPRPQRRPTSPNREDKPIEPPKPTTPKPAEPSAPKPGKRVEPPKVKPIKIEPNITPVSPERREPDVKPAPKIKPVNPFPAPDYKPASKPKPAEAPATQAAQQPAANPQSRNNPRDEQNKEQKENRNRQKDRRRGKVREREYPDFSSAFAGTAKALIPKNPKLSLSISGPKREGDPSAIASRQAAIERAALKAQATINESVDLDGNLFELNNRVAPKVKSLYESLNKKNKKKMVGMMNESAESLEKVISFAVRQ